MILDYHFPDGRHRADYHLARWRLQLLAEMGVGKLVREHVSGEKAAMARMKGAFRGAK